MSLPPVPRDPAKTVDAHGSADDQATMMPVVLRASAGLAVAAALYLVTSTADAYLNVGDRITLSVLSFALVFLLAIAIGLRAQRNAARSRFLAALCDLASSATLRNLEPGASGFPGPEGNVASSFVSMVTTIGALRGLRRGDFDRLTAIVRQESILTVGAPLEPSPPAPVQLEPVPENLAQGGIDAFVLAERGEFGQALAKFGSLYETAAQQLGPLHPFTLRMRANTAYVYSASDQRDVAKRELRALLRDQLSVLGPDHPDVAWTIDMLTELG